MTGSPAWRIERHGGTAEHLHDLVVEDDGIRRLWVLEPTGPAVVLGSTQREDTIDAEACRRDGIAVVRRRSGGGAVWVTADDPVWVDVVVPRDDPLWDDDVARGFLPVGRAWQRALAEVGIEGTTVHDGPMIRTEWSGVVCFAGTGPGEVLRGGAKLVGISQRRTRAGARFQCAVPRRWSGEPLRGLLRPAPPAEALAGIGVGIGDVPPDDLVAAFVRALSIEDCGGASGRS